MGPRRARRAARPSPPPGRFAHTLVATALLAGACSTGGERAVVEEDGLVGDEGVLDLSAITLAETESVPFERIALEGVDPEMIEKLALRVDGPGTVAGWQPVRASDGGGAYVIGPFAADPTTATEVDVWFEHAGARGPTRQFLIQPLPEAPGALDDMVSALRDAIDHRAAQLGTTTAELAAADLSSLPPAELSPKIALTWLDDGTDHDLASTVSGDNPDLERADIDRAERLAAALDLAGLLRTEEVDLPSPTAEDDAVAAEAMAFVGRSTEAPACIEGGPKIPNAQELSEAMITSAVSDINVNPSERTQRTREALDTLLTGGGFGPGGWVFGAVGVGLAAWDALNAGIAGLYPTRFIDLVADVGPTEFAEDAEAPGSWSNVMVTAGSTGWTADANATSVLFGIVTTKMSVHAPKDVTEALLVDLVGTGVNEALNDVLGSESDRVIRFCAETWTVDITDLPFSTAQVLDRGFDVDPGTRTFRPTRVGPDVLRIAPVEVMFGGRTTEYDDALETRPIDVDLLPPEIVVEEPGETVDVEGVISDAEVETLLWNAGAGDWTDGVGDETNGPRTRPLQTPSDREAYPFVISVESLSRQGLRADRDPPRVDTATVRLGGDVRVLEPEGLAKLSSGARLQLDGEPEDGQVEVYPLVVEVLEVEDEASATLRVEVHDQVIDRAVEDLRKTSDGRYLLEEQVPLYDFPDAEESIRITAELTDDGTRQRAVVDPVILLLGYECNWTARVDGYGSWSGDAAMHVPPEATGMPLFYLNFEHFGDSSGRTVVVATENGPGPAPGETGTFVLSTVTVLDFEGRYVWSGEDAELSIVENSGDRMTGSLTSPVDGTNTVTGEETSGSLVIDFSSGTGNPPCSDPTDPTQ